MAEDPFVWRFGARAGWAAQLFYKAIREYSVAAPEEAARAVDNYCWSQRVSSFATFDQKMRLEEFNQMLIAHRDEAVAFAAIALQRERMSPEERNRQKAELSREAMKRAAQAKAGQRPALVMPQPAPAAAPAPAVLAVPAEAARSHRSTVELVFGRGRAPVHVDPSGGGDMARRFRR